MKNGLFSNLKFDLPAGLVVFLVALPLCLGIALASTGSSEHLFSGITSGIVGGIVVGIISKSPLGVSGPAAGLTAIVFSGLATLGSFDIFLLSVVLAGVIQVIFGIVRAGIIGYYFPSAVIKGMLAAIGLILILKQIPHAFGYDKDLMGDEAFFQTDGHNTFSEIYYAVKYSSPGAIIIAALSLAILIGFESKTIKRLAVFKFIPGALIVVLLAILVNGVFFRLSFPNLYLSGDHLVVLPVPHSFEELFGFFTFPDWSAIGNYDVFVIAFTIAIVASVETLLCVEATDKLDPHRRVTPPNRELIAQGIGNTVSGLIGGLPLTQVVVRSSANIDSGGKTRISTIVHGLLLLLFAIRFPHFLNEIPLACLATVLLVVGYKLARVSLFRDMFHLGWAQFMPFIVTIVAILMTDLLIGIGIGLAVSIFYILRTNYRTPYTIERGEPIHMMLSEDVSFLNKANILLTLNGLPNGSSVIIDGSRCAHIDYDVLEVIQEFKRFQAVQKRIKLQLIKIPDVAVFKH